jgi:Ca-activated chloride channel family protein
MNDPAAVLLCSSLRSIEGAPVPLEGVAVEGEVYAAHARLVVRQRYRNVEARPIEAIYTFPLPSDAVLVGFAMECEGRRVEGCVKERDEAFLAYDEALTKGHGAALLDEERKNVFTASVGNLLPGEETVVEIAYVQRLAADEGTLRLVVPTLVAPRYIPGAPGGDRSGHGAASPTDRVPDADRISPRIGAVDYGLSLRVVFDLGRALAIESPSHALVVEPGEGTRQIVRFRRDEVPLDRDVVILASGAAGESAGVVADRARGEEGTFALTIVPDLFGEGARAAARDVVFVVDVSGSMAGDSIDEARSALRLCLRHLVEGDRFNVIAFSTTHHAFEPKLVPFTQRTLERADRWVAALEANGGTEMLEPLLEATSALGDRTRDRVVVLLTDGQVGNEAEIVDRVVAKSDGVRIYGFGIGTNVSDLLLRDLSRRTKGASELIHPGERIDEKVTAQFARATATRIEDVTVRFVGIDASELSPAELPALVDGEPWVVYGRYEAEGLGRVEIRGTLRGERFFLEVPVELPAEAEHAVLPKLWAAARIRDLEDTERSLDGRRAEAQKKRIVALATTHGVSSKYTSFVVVEKRTGDRRANVPAEARPVPVNAPAGWRSARPRPSMPMRAFSAAPVFPGGAPLPRAATAGAPPPSPSPSPSPYAGPPPSPAYARSAPPKPGSSLGAKMKGAIGRLFGSDDAAEGQTFELAESAASSPASHAESEVASGAQELLERQLASGLWAGDRDDDESRLFATARALAACAAEAIDTSHAVYGAQLKKAVAAVCALAATLSTKAEASRAVVAALAAAFLVASGPRARRQVLDTAKASTSPDVKGLASELVDAESARKKLEAMRI